jgi:hypothetical protein
MRLKNLQSGISTAAIIGALIVLIGGGAIAAISLRSDSSEKSSNTSTTPSSSSAAKTVAPSSANTAETADYVFKNWTELRATKKATKCTFLSSDKDSSGTLYYDGDQNGRIDFKSIKDKREGVVYADATNIRFVSTIDGSKKGFIFSADSVEGAKQANVIDPNTSDVKCGAWTADKAYLVAPTDVDYFDISKIIKR